MDHHTRDPFLDLARRQISDALIPMTLAVVLSVLIVRLGVPLLALCLVVAIGGWAWRRGYRIRVIRDREQTGRRQA